MMFVVGRLSGKVQPKYLIAVGAVLIALSMHDMTNVYGDLDFWFMAHSRMLLGVGLPLIFIPIIAASYDGLPPGATDQASALLNAARNTGGSIGISLVANVLWDREQFHQNMLVGNPVERAISGCAASGDELFRRAGQFGMGGQAAGDPMGWTAGTGAGLLPGLYGRLFGADADLARGGAAPMGH